MLNFRVSLINTQLVLRQRGLDCGVTGSGSGSCTMACFGISGFETSSFSTGMLEI
jgi:hypothetical protein